ncbi:MAG: YibE/F family protein [Anaerolineaceae bacterium]|nr:YibE/F family protein [Anaerolineaceae bacterium]
MMRRYIQQIRFPIESANRIEDVKGTREMHEPQRKSQLKSLSGILLSLFILLALVVLLRPGYERLTNRQQGWQISYGQGSVQAEVLQIVGEVEEELQDEVMKYLVLRVRVLEGEHAGEEYYVDYGRYQRMPQNFNIQPGEKVIVDVTERPTDQALLVNFIDFQRTPMLVVLFAIFVLVNLLLSGWQGLKGLLGMFISLVVIVYFIIPQILLGKDAMLVTGIGSFFLLAVTMYLIYGWHVKTHTAVVAILFSLLLTMGLAYLFTVTARITGYGDEELMFVVQAAGSQVNAQGILLSSILIGTLGILDDLVITQASVVFELYRALEKPTFQQIFRRATRVGKDHVAATVNTLVLAYAGASLPVMILFTLSGETLAKLINLEFLAEEVVRTLVGSIGLIAAAPLTTLVACLMLFYGRRWLKVDDASLADDEHEHAQLHSH